MPGTSGAAATAASNGLPPWHTLLSPPPWWGRGPFSGKLSSRSWVWGRRWAIYPEASTGHGTERSISGPTRNGGWKPLRKVALRGAGSLKRAAPRPRGPGAHLKRPVSWPAPLKTYTPAVGTRETGGPALPTRPGQRATGDTKAGPPGQSSQATTFSHLPGTLSHAGPPLPTRSPRALSPPGALFFLRN